MNEWAQDRIEDLERGWARYWPFLEGLTVEQLSTRLTEGRTVKEVLAHIAFWEEAAVGFVRTAIRGENIPDQDWYRGTDLGVKEGDEWPSAEVHNAREAEWAQGQTDEVVLERMKRARRQLIEMLRSVTPEEAGGEVAEYYQGEEDRSKHFEEHLEEIEAAIRDR